MVTTRYVAPPPLLTYGPLHASPRSIAVADVDGDGYPDVVASFYRDSAQWFKNVDGLGGFSAEQAVDTEGDDYVDYAQSVAVADVDGDGNMDVISASLDGVYATLMRPVLFVPYSVVKFVRMELQAAIKRPELLHRKALLGREVVGGDDSYAEKNIFRTVTCSSSAAENRINGLEKKSSQNYLVRTNCPDLVIAKDSDLVRDLDALSASLFQRELEN